VSGDRRETREREREMEGRREGGREREESARQEHRCREHLNDSHRCIRGNGYTTQSLPKKYYY